MAADGTVSSVLLPMSHASAFFCLLVIPTPSIDPHTSTSNPHISILTTFTYTFPRFVFLPPRVLQRGEGWFTPPVSISLDFRRFSGLDISSFPFNARLAVLFCDFGLSILAAASSARILTSFSICYISCIMCTCSRTYDTPHILLLTHSHSPIPPPPFSRPSALLKWVSPPFSVEKKSIFL